MKNSVRIMVVALVVGVGVYLWPRDAQSGELDGFAQCLADKNIIMYGANWCPHCQNEKNRFGDSFRFVTYIECPKDPKTCLDAGIRGYPTWILPGGEKLEGEQGIKKLSEVSGCNAPSSIQ